MSYALGIDLGTTFTAAAVCEPDRRPTMLSLGSSGYTIPSVLFLREDGSFLSGEAAEIRSLSAPTRVARHFKRQLGAPGSTYIAGTPYSPQTLTSHLLKTVLDLATTRQGTEPDTVVLTHPANWGPYRREVFEQAAAMAGVTSKLVLVTEPEAAAIHYASSEKITSGELIAVYDLGGGTFDAVVMRRTDDGFEVVGQPQGVERLGGVDFDDAIWSFVADAAELDVSMLASSDDEAVLAAGHELRNNCVQAKRLLSADTSADIRVALPSVNRTVRMNREEFESRIRPRLAETIGAMENAFRSGGVTSDDIGRILLVGGSSRIPLVGQLLIQHFGRPLAVDSDPKNTVALGAAMRGVITTPDPTELPSAKRPPDIDLSEKPVPDPPAPLDPTIDLTEQPPPKPAPDRLAGSPTPPPVAPSAPAAPAAPTQPARPQSPNQPPAAPATPPAEPVIEMPSTQSATHVLRNESNVEPEPELAEPAEPPSVLDSVLSESKHRVVMPSGGTKKENPFSAAHDTPAGDVEPVSSGSRTIVIAAVVVLLVVIAAGVTISQLMG